MRRLQSCTVALGLLLAFIMPQSASAANINYTANTTLAISGPGINLVIVSGSQANSLAVTSTTFTVTVGAGESFTVRYPGPNAGELVNNGGIPKCNISNIDGSNTAIVNGPVTVTFTPNTTVCPAGGGGSTRISTPASVSMSNPDGGNVLSAGSDVEIKWTTSGTISGITIRLSTDGGVTYPTLVAKNLINTGVYRWTIPAGQASTTKARINVEAVSGDGSVLASDASDANFEIRGTTPVAKSVSSVSNAEAFPGDSQVKVSWTNPTDADFAGVRIVRKKDIAPSSITDGLTIYESLGTTILDISLVNGTNYFYALYAYNKDKAYSSPVVVNAAPSAKAVIPPDSTLITPETPSAPTMPKMLVDFVDLPSSLVFKPGETVTSNYLLQNTEGTSKTFSLVRKVLGPDGKELFTSTGVRTVGAGSSVKVPASYIIPSSAVSGGYRILVEVSLNSKKIAEASLFFAVADQSSLAQRIAGRIVLDVESHGEAWYISPKDLRRYYLGKPDDAYAIMRKLGLGITNNDLAKIPVVGNGGSVPATMINNVSGRILLQVESRGEAWYVDPVTLKRRYMANGKDAFSVMRSLGLGISRADLSKIPIGTL